MTKIRTEPKHFVSFADVAKQHLTFFLFGKVVQGVGKIPTAGALEHPTEPDEPLQLAQVFGYSQDHRCVRLPKPALVLLPEHSGPANDCGWDPKEFVMWEVPSDWVTLLLHPVPGPLARSLQSHALISNAFLSLTTTQQSLEDWQCDAISSDCVRQITKSTRPYNRSEPLQQYGVNSDPQCRAIADLVVGDDQTGVGRYKFKLAETAIGDLSSTWTMGQLANRIKARAVPA
ncbi:MAG TPA: hypothetical protein VOA88_15975 [Candidatus Dormibacteraeota bacterium]|nr:hypothetical protein [Candidatus Dormibacteraeota bacterium]